MIQRTQAENIRQWLGKGKAMIVMGPRQVGKTTLGSSSLLVVPMFERLCTGRLVTIGTECYSEKGNYHQN